MNKKFISILSLLVGACITACGGGGPAAPTPITAPVLSAEVVVSPVISANTYATTYTTSSLTAAVDDSCVITSAQVQYPVGYIGVNPYPALSGNSLKTYPLAVMPTDNWDSAQPGTINNPNINSNCTTSNRAAFLATVQRLKNIGATYITVFQYAFVDNASAPTQLINQDISNADIQWMVANSAGLKVRVRMELPNSDATGTSLTTFASNGAWWNQFFTAYNSFMLAQASNGIDGISLDWVDWGPSWYCNGDSSCNTSKFNNLLTLSTNIHNSYPTVKQWIGAGFLTDDNPTASYGTLVAGGGAFLSSAYLTHLEVSPSINFPGIGAVNILNVKSNLFIPNWVATGTLPVSWQIYVQSHSSWITGTYYDMTCWSLPCAQASASTDFSVQAIAIESMLEFIYTQIHTNNVPTDSITVNGYWWTDTMVPHAGGTATAYPNTSSSIRNKPAEAIIYNWFK